MAFFCVAYACSCNAILGSDHYYTLADPDGGGTPADGAASSPADGGADAADADALTILPRDATADQTDAADTGATTDSGTDAIDCDPDSSASCYACAPVTTWQFLNACTNAKCVPFDDARLTHLLPDGGLPPLPSGDAGDASGG